MESQKCALLQYINCVTVNVAVCLLSVRDGLLVLKVFKPVCDQVQMASALLSKRSRGEVSSEPSVMGGEPRSLNHLPNEILLKIFSHFGPEDLSLIIAAVCERWNVLSKDVTLWKTLSYRCDGTADLSRVVQVRCAALLGLRDN
jgi:hypothetical protein